MIELDPVSILVTVVYVIILYFFLSKVFFQPVLKTLEQRRAAIEGTLEGAERRLREVEEKTAEYEGALGQARSEAYKQQEAVRAAALEERARLLADARAQADEIIVEARERLARETEDARKQLDGEIDRLAERLSTALLRE
jgi:F-type H+-transporting ATPase subunit b